MKHIIKSEQGLLLDSVLILITLGISLWNLCLLGFLVYIHWGLL